LKRLLVLKFIDSGEIKKSIEEWQKKLAGDGMSKG
jgi:hypothetical protein